MRRNRFPICVARHTGLCRRWPIVVAIAAVTCLVVGPAPAADQKWSFVDATSVNDNGTRLAGRVNEAVPDPRDPNVMYIATDGARPTGPDGNPDGMPALGLPDTGGGGVWKTTNWLTTSPAGPNWVPLTDDMPSLSVGVHGLAMAPSNRDILYAAADGPQGAVLKTSDAGKHWQPLGQKLFAAVKFGGIAVSPADPNTVFVAVFRAGTNPRTGVNTPGGVYKSVNGGETWKIVLPGEVSHIVIDPSHKQTLYAGVVDPNEPSRQGVWKSLDGGQSWSSQIANFPSGTFNSTFYIEFAIAPFAPQIVYAVVMKPIGTPLPSFYATQNGGAQWHAICPTNANPDNRFWHQPLTVNPQNPQIVYAEGFNHRAVFTTTGGGTPPNCTNAWTEFWTSDDPAGFTFYNDPTAPGGLAFAAFGDRGIYRVVNPASPSEADFTHKQGDLANPLLVSLEADPNQTSTLYGIAVDQLFALYASPASAPYWTYLPVGAEFGKTLINPDDPSIVYNICPVGITEEETYCDPTTFITRLSGGTWSPIANGFSMADFPFFRTVVTDPAAWKALEFDPATAEGLLYGGTRIWAWTASSGVFVPISPYLANAAPDTTSFISAIGIAQSNPNIVYVGTSEGTMFVTNGRQSWPQITRLTLPSASFVSRIRVDPLNPQHLVIAVQGATGPGRVWVSNHGGADWSDITRNLPPGLEVYTAAVDWEAYTAAGGRRFPNPHVYVGTDRGVYATTLQARGWWALGTGLPDSLVSDLEISPTRVMTAAVYGRGAYQLQLSPGE